MFVNFGHKEGAHCLKIAAQLRNEGLKVEVYPDSAKMKKQMTYANKKNIAFVALVGEEEMNAGTVTLKNMGTGEQNSVKVEDIIGTFSE
jgi:histidyl-tRNA synthetase